MSDNNRFEFDIVANDDTGPATAKVRANFDSMEQQAAKTAANMNKGFDAQAVSMGQSIDRASASAMRSLDALERRAALAGKSAVEKLVIQRNQLIGTLGSDEAGIQRTMAAYDKLISARQKYEAQMAKMDAGGGHGSLSTMVARRGFLAVKDFGEGRTSGTMAEVADIMFGQGGSSGVVQKVIPQIAEITGLSNVAVIAVGSLAAAFAGLEFAGFKASEALAEQGKEIQNFSLRTGIAPPRVQAFQFAAKASGVDPNIFERMTRGLAQATNDDSPSGNRARKEIQDLGLKLYDDFGDLKPTEQIVLELADGINKLPPGLKQSAASMEIFKRIGVEAIPVLKDLRENLKTSDEVGGTFTEADLKMFEEWHKQLATLGLEWTRFKAEVEIPLAVTFKYTLKAASTTIGLFGAVAELGRQNASGLFLDDGSAPDKPKPPSADQAFKTINLVNADAARARLHAMEEADPAFRLAEARKKLTDLRALAEHGSPEQVDSAIKQFQLVKGLEQKGGSNTALKGVVAARKEQLQLNAQYAEIQQSSQQKLLSASLDSRHELSTPEDVASQLQLAKQRVDAEQQKILNDRRYKVDDKTGTIRDLSGTADYQRFQNEEAANLPLRLRNEYAKVLGDLAAQDARYFKARNDADGKAWEEAWQRRKKGELDLQQEEINTRQQIQTRQFDIDGQAIDRQKEMALQGLGLIDAQTLKDKIALEDQKLAIEDAYAERSLANRIAKLQNQEALAVAEIQKKAAESGNSGSDAEAADIASKQAEYQQQIDAARASTGDKEIIDAQKTANTKEKLAIESNKRVYDSLKHDAEGLFDQLVFHTKSWGEFAKDIFKATILTPVKEVFSSQVAALFTKGITGSDVSFGEVGNGQGAFGKLGSIFGRAGLGQPRFGDANHPLAKLGAPNHLGDLSLVSGAVPVVLMNSGGGQGPVQQAARSGGFSFGSLAAGLGLGGLFAGRAAAAVTPASSAGSYGYKFPDGIIDGTNSPGTFSSGGDGSVGSAGATSSSGGGLFSSLGHSLMGGIGKLFGRGDGSAGSDTGETDAETGLPLGHGIPGSEDNSSGESGDSKGVSGPLGALLVAGGTALAMDGWKRRGPVGMVEMGAGGAAIGYKFGGPLGALIGGGVGLLAGGLHWAFGGGDQKHAKELVKQIYGLDINNATADQIVQIAKQSFGNQIDVAVRSPQVRELLKLYSQATGQKKAEDQFVQDTVHSASFSESGGKLFQNAVYDNGNAYSYSSPLSTYGGVTTAPLSTYAPNQGVFSGSIQLNVNGQSAADLLEGRITNTVTPGFVQGQALAASSSSIGRTSQQNMALSPSALTR